MKELLERWATLEPSLCKRETRPNPFKPEDIERFDIFTPYGWQTVYSHDSYYDEYNSPMKVQWAVQQAVITNRYDLMMEYTPEFGYKVELGIYQGESDTSMAEALLAAYLEALSD